MLHIVEDQEEATSREVTLEAIAERPGITFVETDTARNGRDDAPLDRHTRRERQRTCPWGSRSLARGRREAKLRLTDATGSDQGQQTNIVAQRLDNMLHVVRSPDQRDAGSRHVDQRLRLRVHLAQIDIVVDRVPGDESVKIDTQPIGQITERAQWKWARSPTCFDLRDSGLRERRARRASSVLRQS